MFRALLNGSCRLLRPVTGRSACRVQAIHSSQPLNDGDLSDFQLTKITQDFDHVYDKNKDGFIDKSDVQAVKTRLRLYTETVHGKAIKDVYKAGFDDFWDILVSVADTNKDGFVSREEWIRLWQVIVKGKPEIALKSLPQWVRMVPASLFPVLDAKGDGVIDKQEYRDFWHHVGGYRLASEEDIDRYFKHMTEDGEKPIDLPRLEYLYADFYLSDDPATPGKYIAGPIRFDLDQG